MTTTMKFDNNINIVLPMIGTSVEWNGRVDEK